MAINIQKLDARHNGHWYFTHRVEISGNWDQRREQFVQMREWCWENFGPGVERDLVDHKPETKWAWHVHDRPTGFYIYLKDELLTYFSLKWK